MARVLILGGGFGGLVAAERLAADLGDEHQISLVSRTRHFVFYPALVRLAFGACEQADVSFDLRQTLLSRRVNFIEAEVARIDPENRKVIIAHGDLEGKLSYDFLVFALGRRLATERIPGFHENAHQLLNVDKALRFGKAINGFHEGRAVIGQCPGARLPMPVYETAFALSRSLEARGDNIHTRITIVSPNSLVDELGDVEAAQVLTTVLAKRGIDFLPGFRCQQIKPGTLLGDYAFACNFKLLMLVPPFVGSSAASYLGITNEEGYINVDSMMRVIGLPNTYAIGDSVNLSGPKLGHMAVRQGVVAAENLAAEIAGCEPVAKYRHDMRVIIDEGGAGSIYLHKDLEDGQPATVRQGRFWSWAKRVQKSYWEGSHSS